MKLKTRQASKAEARQVKWKTNEHISKKEAIEKRIREINKQMQTTSKRNQSPYNERMNKTN